MHTFFQDLRHALRLLAKTPWATGTAIIALALGIGANTAIFSVINGVLLEPLPFPEPDRLVQLERAFPQGRSSAHSVPRFVYWREHNTVLEKMTAYDDLGTGFNLTGDGPPERIRGSRVSQEFFSVFGVQPALGRDFVAEDDRPGAAKVVILSDRLWRRRFGGDPGIVNSSVVLSGESYTVVGIMPDYFRYPSGVELWTPVQIDPADTNPGNYLNITGRLKDGVTVDEALAEMKVVQRRFLDSQGAPPDASESASVRPLHEFLYGYLRPSFLVLLGAVVLVLLIACANVANLEMARSASREKEMALRAALGAGTGRIVRQVLTEGVVLSFFGGLLGLLLCMGTLRPLLSLAPSAVARFQDVRVDGSVLAFTFAIALLSGLIFALAPAFQTRRIQLSETLKEGSTGSGAGGGVRGYRIRTVLVVSEVALTFVLMVGAHLLIRSFEGLRSTEPGFVSDNVLTMKLAFPETKYGDPVVLEAFTRQVLGEVESLPGVRTAVAVNTLPLEMGPDLPFVIEGRRFDPDTFEGVGTAQYRMCTPQYFETFGIPLLKGRVFDDSNGSGTPGVVIINQATADRYWPDEDPIGRQITIGGPLIPEFSDPAPRTVIAVVGNVREVGIANDPPNVIYIPVGQVPPFAASALMRFMPYALAVKTDVAPETVTRAVEDVIWRHDADQPITGVATMAEIVDRSIGSERFNMLLLGLLAGIALLLAVVGIYGVIAYVVSQRTREIGIRIAMGARGIDVARLVLRQGLGAVLLGIVIGFAGALASTRLLAGLIYGVSTTDPATFVAVSLLLAFIATLAIALPARRASRVDPLVALRYE
jgi:predicted permease